MSSFKESSILEVDVGQTFLKGYTFSPCYTLVSEEWPRVGNGLDSYSSREDSFSLGYTFLVSEEWPRVGSSPGSAIRNSYSSRVDSFSPSYTLFSVGRMAQGGE